MMTFSCAELYQQQDKKGGIKGMKEPNAVSLYDYQLLHREGKTLIRGWFDRAWKERNNDDELFESFIFTWISFNSWGACVTGTDKDADIMDSLAADSRLNADFDLFVSQEKSQVSVNSKRLYDLIPIFDAKSLRNLYILRYGGNDTRRERVDFYIANGATRFDPQCWKRHIDSGENVPLDWSHVLKAIYKIRCNLFHGQKAAHSEMDRKIVSSAFRTLLYFLDRGGYIN